MIKGVQRKMIVVKNVDGGLFEEAHFILRASVKETPRSKDDLLSEANRIIAQNHYPAKKSGRGGYSRRALLLAFLSGALLSLAAAALAWLAA